MFEHFVSTFKKRSDNLSGSIPQIDMKKTSKISTASRLRENFDSLKYKLNNYASVSQHDEDLQCEFLSPRAYKNTVQCVDLDLNWSTLNDKTPSLLDKFTKIVAIDEETSSALLRRRNDREEIRRRLAMGTDPDDYRSYHVDRPGRKPSLQTRLQSGMNLQICFMNETASDNESPNSDGEGAAGVRKLNTSTYSLNDHPYQTRPLSVNIQNENQVGGRVRPSSLSLRASSSRPSQSLGSIALTEADFFARQARLQTEARMALAQAKEMARIQMERDRDSRAISPVTDMLRRSLLKANAPLPHNRRRVSRQILTDMNVAQLQVIVNELHTQIENLNESLVKMLMARDELHMGQDSMLVDIEDLTRYLGAKEQGSKNKSAAKNKSTLAAPLPVAQPPPRSILAVPASAIKPKLHRFVSLVRK